MATRSQASTTPANTDLAAWPFVTPQAFGCCIDVVVVPNARQTEAIGLHDGCLRLRLAAQPIDGAANDALQRWLARSLGVSRSSVQLERGLSSRRKRLRVEVDRAVLLSWLHTLPTAPSG